MSEKEQPKEQPPQMMINGIALNVEKNHGIYEVLVSNDQQLFQIATKLHDAGFDRCVSVTAEDKVDKLDVIWHLSSYSNVNFRPINVQVRITVDKNESKVSSLTPLWQSAIFHEREAYEMFGVIFSGHPNLKPILLPDEFIGKWPMRKDFQLVKHPWRKQQ